MQESPPPAGEATRSPATERVKAWAVCPPAELVMDKVSAVLRPLAPVGARDHYSVSQLWLT